MKYFLGLISFWTISSSANPICSSIWIFKAYNTCAHPAHGLDLSSPAIPSGELDLESDYLRGGADQQKVCLDVQAQFNKANLNNGQFASLSQPTPVRENSKRNALGEVKYKYWCHVSIQKYPFLVKPSAACGTEERFSYKVGGDGSDIEGTTWCLSCEEFGQPETKVACLKGSLKEVIGPRAVDLREADLAAVAKEIASVLNVNKYRPIHGLQDDMSTLSDFADFVTAHPPRR